MPEQSPSTEDSWNRAEIAKQLARLRKLTVAVQEIYMIVGPKHAIGRICQDALHGPAR